MTLTIKQKKFADEYMRTGNATKASHFAGYSRKYAGQNAGKLLKNPKIAEYIAGKTAEMESERIAKVEEVKAFWTEIMRNEQAEMTDRIKASQNLARTGGAFNERLQIAEANEKRKRMTYDEMESELDRTLFEFDEWLSK